MDGQSNNVLEDKIEQFASEVESKAEKIGTRIEKEVQLPNSNWPALIIIFIGVLALLNSTGVLAWSIWLTLFRFWPVILVLVGLNIILGRSFLGRLAMFIVTVLALLFIGLLAIWSVKPVWVNQLPFSLPTWITDRLGDVGEMRETQLVVDRLEFEGIETLSVDFSAGLSTFTLTDNPDAETYFSLDAKYYDRYGVPVLTREEDEGNLIVTIKQEDQSVWVPVPGEISYDGVFGVEKLKDLAIEVGAGRGTVVLDETIDLNTFDVSVGIGSIDVTLSKGSLPNASVIDVGVGKMVLRVPSGTGYRFEYDLGLGSLKVNGEKLSKAESGEDSVFESVGYAKATSKLNLTVNVGLGSFELITED